MKFVKMNGSTAIVSVQGAFDIVTSFSVAEELSNAYNNGCNAIEVDFENTTYIDSAAIGELVKARRKVGQENFKVKNPQNDVLKTLKGSRLMEWIQ